MPDSPILYSELIHSTTVKVLRPLENVGETLRRHSGLVTRNCWDVSGNFSSPHPIDEDSRARWVRGLGGETGTKTATQEAEFNRAIEALKTHDKVYAKLTTMQEAFSKSIGDLTAPLPDPKKTMLRFIEYAADNRAVLAEEVPKIEQLYFESPALKTLQTGLVMDLKQLDQYWQQRQELAESMLRSPQRGDEIVALARADEDGKRYAQEAAVRDRTFDEIIEQARREHNDQVVETTRSCVRIEGPRHW